MMKNYSTAIQIDDFEKRLDYLKLDGFVGDETFGHNRWICQNFYRTPKWKRTRDMIIVRDTGCDLAFDGYEIHNILLIVHHINPITVNDILNDNPCLYDPENLICTTKATHDYIHYGKVRIVYKERTKNDTAPWIINKED